MIFISYTKSDTYYEFVGENGQKLIYPVSSIILTDDESCFIAVKNTASRQTIGLLAKPIPPFSGKFKLTLSDSSTVSAECDSTSAVTSGEVSSQYSGTVVSAEIGQCVTSIGENAFYNCTSLTSVTIPNSVTSIGYSSFSYCKSLTQVDIPDSVTIIDHFAFSWCSGFTSVVIPDSVTTIGSNAFRNCTNLESINIPSGVTNIDVNTFRNSSGIISIDIPSGVTNIGNNAFNGCSGLTSVTCNATTPPTLGSNVFNNSSCPIYVPAASVDVYKAAAGWSTYTSRITAIV